MGEFQDRAGREHDGDDSPEIARLQRRLSDYERWFRNLDDHIRVLERERQRLSALINYTDAGFVLIDPDSKVVWTNTAFAERFGPGGPQGADATGMSCGQVVCRKGGRCAECPAAELFRTGKVAHHELNLLLGQKEFRHVYATAIPVHSLDGKLEQAIVMLQDLSNLEVLQRSEEALRTTEQRYRSIFEQAGAGMITVRADRSILQANPTFCTMLGYTEAELLDKKITDLTHHDDRAGLLRSFASMRARGRRAIEMERRLVRRDGETVWAHSTSVWQFDEDGTPTYSVELVHDISERKRAEEALEKSRKQYEALVHSIDGIVWEADPRAFRFSFVSKQAERILGYPLERWLAQPRFWRNQIHPEDLDRVVSALSHSVRCMRGHEIEYRMLSTDGRVVWMRDTVSMVVEHGEVSKLRGLMVDVTERMEAEEALRHSEEQLRQSQKMEAIGRLAGGIAHDFNNLLTAITGYGDFLIRGLGPDHELYREAREIYRAAERAADLTGQLLAFSRQQVLQPKVLDLKDVVADMEMMLRRVIGEHISLTTRLDAPVGAVKADPGQIQQVILNLAVNARDAMQGGGELRIEVADVTADHALCARLPGLLPGDYVALAVTDTGCGIDDETRLRLFEPFFTTKEQGKGTGLGLSTVYGIVKQSGGNISVDSEPGRGTTFRIHLPRVDEAVAGALGSQETAPEPVAGTEHILLVEDDDSVRELAREILEMHGYRVIEACDGLEALSVFEAHEEEIALMVTDLVMPQLGGRDLAARLAPEHPELRVLFLSGYTDNAAMHQGLLASGSFFLQKPFTPADLALKVREALDSLDSLDS